MVKLCLPEQVGGSKSGHKDRIGLQIVAVDGVKPQGMKDKLCRILHNTMQNY